jgi:hypothetical protein
MRQYLLHGKEAESLETPRHRGWNRCLSTCSPPEGVVDAEITLRKGGYACGGPTGESGIGSPQNPGGRTAKTYSWRVHWIRVRATPASLLYQVVKLINNIPANWVRFRWPKRSCAQVGARHHRLFTREYDLHWRINGSSFFWAWQVARKRALVSTS